ncbi:hypothetical protein Q7W20_05195 [Streptococcus suis]|nr:hypothetical protein [Streptococcus suis]
MFGNIDNKYPILLECELVGPYAIGTGAVGAVIGGIGGSLTC